MEMQEQALKQKSQTLLSDLGKALSKVYPEDMTSHIFDDLLAQLDTVEYTRETNLECANQRLKRLLSNTANHIAQ